MSCSSYLDQTQKLEDTIIHKKMIYTQKFKNKHAHTHTHTELNTYNHEHAILYTLRHTNKHT